MINLHANQTQIISKFTSKSGRRRFYLGSSSSFRGDASRCFRVRLRGSELLMEPSGSQHRVASFAPQRASPHCIKGLLLGRFLPIFTDFYRFFGLSWENSILDTRVSLTCNHLGSSARLITPFSISSMVLLRHARVFSRGFLESRKYKIRIVARVGRKSAVVPSGVMEASYPRFFIGLDLLS